MTVATCLWFDRDTAPRAVELYQQLVPGFRVTTHRHLEQDGGPGTDVWEVELSGTPYQVMGADGAQPFTMGTSLSLRVDDQATLDAFWDGLLQAGGKELACGWITDPFGVMWQVVPEVFFRTMADGTQEQAQRVAESCWNAIRLDVDAMERAARS